ncbi:MAG: hypothetical protein ALECFALPRED_003332 [Alectoria fallacina]|uniref:Homologous-pairing protein 2 winged helix domain-containing protein n=1 Tax=Alectoria fallacina TaxID=1903189 RepID=A0A8H3EKG2_9LECA|nr:MAG: hypothetical protein ALECFALPRED_003332 [Alectoria fallacina]
MAPRKEKTDKVTADQGDDNQTIRQSARSGDSGSNAAEEAEPSLLCERHSHPLTTIIKSQPLTPIVRQATDISANLHNKVTKTYAAKVLKELHESQVIAGKGAGKQWVYHAVQDPDDAMSLEDIAAMDREIADLRETIATAKANEKLLRANLISVNATLSTEELRSSVSLLGLEKKEMVARLGPLRSGNVKRVEVEEKEAVDKAWKEWSRKARSRKKICMELWVVSTEEMEPGKTRKELWV